AEFTNAGQQGVAESGAVGLVESARFQFDRAEPAFALCDHGLLARIPFDSLSAADMGREFAVQGVAIDGCGEPDRGLARSGIEIGDYQKLRLADAVHVHELGAAPV